MTLYLITIAVCALIIVLVNYFFASPMFGFSIWFVILATLASIIAAMLLDGFMAWITHRLPKKCANPFNKFYLVSKKEKTFLEKVGVRKFKDFLPDLGGLAGFKKGKIDQPKNKEYIYKYMEESCYGEIDHWLSIPFGFLIIFILPLKYWLCFGIPVAFVNAVLNLMPVMSLRYNRYALTIIYKRLEKQEKTSSES